MTAIKRLRNQHGKSQADLAEMLEVSQQTVSAWEQGQKIPRPKKLLALARLFGCTVDDLLRDGGEEDEDDDTGVKRF